MTTVIDEAEERAYAKVTWTLLPFLGVCYLIVRHAERHNEKRWHVAIAAALGGAGLALSAASADGTWLTVAFVTLASTGGLVAMSLFWSFPGSLLVGASLAAGLAAVNSVGNPDGFIGSYLLGGCMAVAGGLIGAPCKGYGFRMTQSSPHGE